MKPQERSISSITIDQREVPFEPGETIHQAAARAGIPIPLLCHQEGFRPSGGCLVCAVRDEASGRMLPACAHPAIEGMRLTCETEAVRAFRRQALELLLCDHLGECTANCERACPADLRIPRFLACLEHDDLAGAAGIVRHDLALAGILGRVCHHPCQKVCRRAHHDETVPIRALERAAADGDVQVASGEALVGQRIAVYGDGPAALAVAWYLALEGARVSVCREGRGAFADELIELGVDADVAEAELVKIRELGVEFDPTGPGDRTDVVALVCVATEPPKASNNLPTFRFASRRRELVHLVGAARRLVSDIVAELSEHPADSPAFTCVLRRLQPEEMADLLRDREPETMAALPKDDLRRQAARCLQCRCAVAETCRLRALAGRYEAHQKALTTSEPRFAIRQVTPLIDLEVGKCILCLQCLEVARRAPAGAGLAVRGRGFTAEIAPALGEALDGQKADQDVARACVACCPTAALRLRQAG